MRFWPYRILRRDDEQIRGDLTNIMDHFSATGESFDMVVFIPNAGLYLGERFAELYGDTIDVRYLTIRRASSVAKPNAAKAYIFKKKWLADLMRHVEVLLRLVKQSIGLSQKMSTPPSIEFEVGGRRVLVLDDSVDTGTTLRLAKELLLAKGAASVKTACISNHLMPRKVHVDHAVYEYRLLRTINSRDYHAV